MDKKEKLILIKSPFTFSKLLAIDEVANAALQGVYGGDEEAIKEDVREKRAELYRVVDNLTDEIIAHFVCRVDVLHGGCEEFVIMCAVGSNSDLWLPLILMRAKDKGCLTCRVHSVRMGMSRKLAKYGFSQSEIIYRTEL